MRSSWQLSPVDGNAVMSCPEYPEPPMLLQNRTKRPWQLQIGRVALRWAAMSSRRAIVRKYVVAVAVATAGSLLPFSILAAQAGTGGGAPPSGGGAARAPRKHAR